MQRTLIASILLSASTAVAEPRVATVTPATPEPAPAITQPNPHATDHMYELGARIGMLSGGEMRPKGTAFAELGTSFVLFAEANRFVHPYFMLGVYTTVIKGTLSVQETPQLFHDEDFLLLGAGGVGKTRIKLGPNADLRIGMHIGSAFVNRGGGRGINMAPTLEGSYRVKSDLALTAQVSFISQVSGSANVDDSSRSFLFAPMWFFSVGAEMLK